MSGTGRSGEPIEPSPTTWSLPDPAQLYAGSESPVEPSVEPDEGDDLVGVGADLEPGTVLAAYRRGLFPMPLGPPPRAGTAGITTERRGSRRPAPVGWWSPVSRGVLELDDLVVSRSLRRARRDFEIRVDTAFAAVVEACGDPRRPHGWIDARIKAAYVELHRLGWAHSVETWRDGRLEGGLYGLGIGGLFAGESMFHRARDASKVALVGLVEILSGQERVGPGPGAGPGRRLVDVQWSTPHLAGLGVSEVPRAAYLARLPGLLAVPHARFAVPEHPRVE